MKFRYFLIFVFFATVLTACVGTGTKNLSAINFEVPSDDSAIFLVRKKKYFGSAALVKIIVDGREVGKLGVGEMERIAISPGSHTINVKIGSILQAGIGGDATAFIAEKGQSYFFIADMEQGFFAGKWTITPTTKAGFTQVLN